MDRDRHDAPNTQYGVALDPEHASAVLLASGDVLVAGGTNYGPIAQTWNPATGLWSATRPMRAARESFTLTTLASGLVLAAGGCDGDYCTTVLGSAKMYHPTTRTWTSTGHMVEPRYGHTATLLPTGKVRVTGGTDTNQDAATVTELYNPATGTWTAAS